MCRDDGEEMEQGRIEQSRAEQSREWNLSAERAAKKIGCSREHFCRQFKKRHRITFKKHCNQLKLVAVRRILEVWDTDRQLKTIDHTFFGFPVYKNFSAWFKRHAGLSPSEYLRSRR